MPCAARHSRSRPDRRHRRRNSVRRARRMTRAGIACAALVGVAALAAGAWIAERSLPVAAAIRQPVAAVGALEAPFAEGVSAQDAELRGWAAHPRGIDRVELRVAGQVLIARYGEPREDIT